jgi:hypothetical protein
VEVIYYSFHSAISYYNVISIIIEIVYVGVKWACDVLPADRGVYVHVLSAMRSYFHTQTNGFCDNLNFFWLKFNQLLLK